MRDPLSSESFIDIKSPLLFQVLYKALRDERATLDVTSSLPWPNDGIFRWVSTERVNQLIMQSAKIVVEEVDQRSC